MATARKMASFIHLRVKSAYSLLEGAVRPQELASLATESGMPAVAVTDTNNLFGVYEIADTLAKAGVQPIVGALLSVELAPTPATQHGSRKKPPHLPLLVQDEAGYRNLTKLLSAAYLKAEPGDWPHVKAEMLAEHSEGLIALTGGPGGPVNALLLEGQNEAAAGLLDRLAAIFPGRLYVELQRHNLPEERATEAALIDLAYARKLPLVATNDVHFGPAAMYEAHDALLCIADGSFVSQDDRRRLTREHRFKTPAEMSAQFADLPEALDNTIEIARRCAWRPMKRKPILPVFVPESGRNPDDELKVQAELGLARRMAAHTLAADANVYHERLAYELSIINRMGFPGYFLIVSDFMKWTKGQGIPVGVRGSGASSLVAWALDITNLDPLRFGLFFERFLNPERISMPDFDIDFCQERRDEVVRYVRDKYGADRVAHIIALGSLQARAAVRDAGRVLQMPLGLVDRIAKLIPNPPGKPVSLKDAIESEPRLRAIAESEPIAQRLFEITSRIEGLYRHASTHPAGVVIGDQPLDEILPLYRDPRSDMPVTQFDYEDAEKAGLVKFDFLGLKTLTVIAKAEELLARRGISLKTQEIDFDDPGSFEMLARGDSVGVFIIELRHRHVGARIAIQRQQFVQRPVADHHARRMGRSVAIQALDLAGDVEQALRQGLGFCDLLQARFTFQRLLQGDGFARRVGNHLGDAIHQPQRHLQHPAGIAHGGTRLQASQSHDLRHAIMTILAPDIAHDLVAPLLAEIDVEVRHRLAFGIEEALEEQAEAQGIEVGDVQRPGHQRRRARAAHADGNALAARPFHEVGDDQEITGKAHAVDDGKLIGQALVIDIFLGGMGMGRQHPRQAFFGLHFQFIVGLAA